jgi:rhamnogalacturonyl hydrolase YesR
MPNRPTLVNGRPEVRPPKSANGWRKSFWRASWRLKRAKRKFVIYPEVCAWYGSLTVAQLTKDADLKARLIAKFEPLMTPEGSKMISPDAHVDYRVFGTVPLELYLQTKEQRYLDLGKRPG